MFGENLREIQKRWGMTQWQLAELIADDEIKMKKDSISNLCNAKTRPTVKLICKLEKLTGIPVLVLEEEYIEAQDIPKKPLDLTTSKDVENPYEQNNWRRLRIEDFFAKSQEMFKEMKSIQERLLALENKLSANE